MTPLNVLLIGGGGREHALALAIARSPLLGTLYATHVDNPGIAALARPADVPVNIREIYRLQQFIEKHAIDLVVVGPEEPLADGFADKLASPRTRVFGPVAAAARLEGDKAWAKQLMRSASIPTAEARVFTNADSARAYVESRESDDPVLARLAADLARHNDPAERRRALEQRARENRDVQRALDAVRPDLPVIKAAGLAKGKGVVVPASLTEAFGAIDDIMVRRIHGDAGKQIVVEERLDGPEVSVLALCDGRTLYVLPPCQDHKRLGDNDTGPNTGGMGAFCPSNVLDETLMARVEREVLVPVVDALRREDVEFKGVLYAGLMLTHAGPKVLEFNVRFGDPECQPLMARLRTDLLRIMLAVCDGRLDETAIEWDPRPACCVVLASAGYPEKPRTGLPIVGLDRAAALPDVTITHAGTRRAPDGTVVTAGGRVLGVTALADTMAAARDLAYRACELIHFEGKTLRTDIAARQ
ncbi:MAG: phosphoribosylamine--glycine ligase [Planctomycetota bacterium]|nr:phosphoribosylamine--glycine ligase [Planctomycetota bacterium]